MVFVMLILKQNIQTKIEKHIETINEAKKYSNALFVMLISWQNIQTKIKEHFKIVHEEKKIFEQSIFNANFITKYSN